MATKGQLVIVASCTMRKKGEIPKALRFGRYARSSNGTKPADAAMHKTWIGLLELLDTETPFFERPGFEIFNQNVGIL